jgi:Cu/Ag efflux pump CusA
VNASEYEALLAASREIHPLLGLALIVVHETGHLLGYNWSVAVAIGFIALAGVASETGVIMLIESPLPWSGA